MSRACLCICISPFLRLPLWFFLILTTQCAAVFSTLTTSLSPSANPFFPPNSHLHYSPPRLTILFSVSIISKVFSLDTAMTSRLHYNKYSYYSPSVFLSSHSLYFSSSSHSVLFLIICREVDKTAAILCGASMTPLSSKGRLRWTGFSLPLICSTNPPGELYQIELPVCVICMKKKTEAWLIILADALPVGDSPSLNGVAEYNCYFPPQVTVDDAFVGQCCPNTLRRALKADIRVNLLGFSG